MLTFKVLENLMKFVNIFCIKAFIMNKKNIILFICTEKAYQFSKIFKKYQLNFLNNNNINDKIFTLRL